MKTGKYVKFLTRISLTSLKVLIFKCQKNKESCKLIKHHYRNETFSSRTISKEDILNYKKAEGRCGLSLNSPPPPSLLLNPKKKLPLLGLNLSKTFPQAMHAFQMACLQKLLKTLEIVFAKNLKILSINAYKKISFHI